MKLRFLEEKDASLMLEWMHDENVLVGLQREKFINKTLDDCIHFIKVSKEDDNNINLAIVDDNDVYMGTVSLKNINRKRLDAEFAITLRSCAMGKGFSKFAIKGIIEYAFEVLKLNCVYWNVLADNKRAINCYNHLGYNQVEDIHRDILIEHEDMLNKDKKFLWYLVTKD